MVDMQEMAECQGPAVTLSLLSQMFQIYSVQNHVKKIALYLQFESMRSCYAFKFKKKGAKPLVNLDFWSFSRHKKHHEKWQIIFLVEIQLGKILTLSV